MKSDDSYQADRGCGIQCSRSFENIFTDMISSGLIATVTSAMTGFMNYAIDSAMEGKTLMEVSEGFGESMKMFFCRLDDALVYII